MNTPSSEYCNSNRSVLNDLLSLTFHLLSANANTFNYKLIVL